MLLATALVTALAALTAASPIAPELEQRDDTPVALEERAAKFLYVKAAGLNAMREVNGRIVVGGFDNNLNWKLEWRYSGFRITDGHDRCLRLRDGQQVQNGATLALVPCNGWGYDWEQVNWPPGNLYDWHQGAAISLAGSYKLCLDLRDGKAGNEVQLWDCYDNSANQKWFYSG